MCTPDNPDTANAGDMSSSVHPSLEADDRGEAVESYTEDMLTFKPTYTKKI